MKRILNALKLASIEVFLSLLCFVAGLPIILSPSTYAPSAVLALLPFALVVIWGLCLVLGGFADLLGIATDNLYLRRAGLALLSAGSVVMAMAVLAVTGSARLFVVGTYLVFAWATGARYAVLGNTLNVRRERWRRAAKSKEE